MSISADKKDQMSPSSSPGVLQKKSSFAGVRRVNNMPVYLFGGAVFLFLVIMGLVAADRAENQNSPSKKEVEKAGNTSMFAQEIAGNYADGIIEPALMDSAPLDPDLYTPEAPLPNADADPLLIARPNNPNLPPPPSGQANMPPPMPNSNTFNNMPLDDEAERIRMAKLQMFEEAVKARSTVQTVSARSPGSSSSIGGAPQSRNEMANKIASLRQEINTQQATDPTAAYHARLALLQGQGAGSGGEGGGGFNESASLLMGGTQGGGMSGDDYGQFDNASGEDRWELTAKPEAPRSPFELRAGFVVPATLVSGINSELPGQIMAQVSQSVYDTATGKYLLIPQGSRLVGSYSSDVAYGQARVLVAWQRIIFPDGKAMDIGSMPGSDSAGYSGFKDKVNNHYFRVFSAAFLMSGVTAGVAMSQGDSTSENGRPTASSAMSEALGQQLGQVIGQMVARNLNIAPTLEIRPGYRFNVVVTKDMTFSKPYKSFDY